MPVVVMGGCELPLWYGVWDLCAMGGLDDEE